MLTFSFLYIFITGGAISGHFHIFLTMAFVSIYADWRLGWIVAILAIIHNVILNYTYPQAAFFYGTNILSPFAHALAFLAMAIYTSQLCRNHRQALIIQKELENKKSKLPLMN